jgi:hypothetical protein
MRMHKLVMIAKVKVHAYAPCLPFFLFRREEVRQCLSQR